MESILSLFKMIINIILQAVFLNKLQNQSWVLTISEFIEVTRFLIQLTGHRLISSLNPNSNALPEFTTGKTDYVIKWVVKPTRKLHPLRRKRKNWSPFTATKNKSKVFAKERIYNDSGQNRPDVSGWFWSALFKKNSGSWWVVTTSEE